MQKQFCSYDIALKLKELGFMEDCLFVYNSYKVLKHIISGTNPEIDDYISFNKYDNRLPAPLWQQCIEWFREKHNIVIEIWYDNTQEDGFPWMYEIYISNIPYEPVTGEYFDTYIESREQAIIKAIEILTEQNQNK